MPSNDRAPRAPGPDLGRRRLLVGTAAAGVAWTTPSIVRSDIVGAAVGSCTDTTVNWTSVSGSSPAWTATGTSGTTTITAFITANLSGGSTPSVFISASRIVLAVSGHSIGDYYDVVFTFVDSSGATICTASTTVIDIDQNDRLLGCATNSRFRDEISNITGPSTVVTPTANVAEGPAGTWGSTINCKTGDIQNITIGWTDSTGVTGTGFRYTMATPPGTSTTLDYQLVKIDPVTMCIENATSGAPPPRNLVVERTAIDLVALPDQD